MESAGSGVHPQDRTTFRVSALQLACLQFCAELVDQEYQDSPFDCALVCALAALGVDVHGWLNRDVYVDTLFCVHRIT
jgi:hypothetical protein